MQIVRGVSVGVFAVGVFVASACSTPLTENAERTAACKDSGNSRMCNICCKTKQAKYTQEGVAGSCSCLGEFDSAK